MKKYLLAPIYYCCKSPFFHQRPLKNPSIKQQNRPDIFSLTFHQKLQHFSCMFQPFLVDLDQNWLWQYTDEMLELLPKFSCRKRAIFPGETWQNRRFKLFLSKTKSISSPFSKYGGSTHSLQNSW